MDVSKTLSFEVANDVKQICEPFFREAGINYFDYARFYKDGSTLGLISDAQWFQHYFNNEYPISGSVINAGIHLWEGYMPHVARDAKESFNIDNGFTIAKDCGEYIEFYDFATPCGDPGMKNYFINHLEVLDNFVFYFKDKAQTLISKAENARIVVPDNMKGTIKLKSTSSLKSAIEPKHYLLTIDGENIRLTPREMRCLIHYCQCKSAKSIGKLLSVSPKTVEFHLSNVKIKLKMRTREQLFMTIASHYPHLIYQNDINK